MLHRLNLSINSAIVFVTVCISPTETKLLKSLNYFSKVSQPGEVLSYLLIFFLEANPKTQTGHGFLFLCLPRAGEDVFLLEWSTMYQWKGVNRLEFTSHLQPLGQILCAMAVLRMHT